MVGATLSALLVVSGVAVAAASPASAETTNTDRVWIDASQTFYAYTAAGETLDVNFTPFNIKLVDMNFEGGNQQATANVRESVNVKVTAPDGAVTDCVIPHNTPVSVSNDDPTPVANQVVCDLPGLTSATAGAWKIEFTRGNESNGGFRSAVAWEITAKAGGVPVNGRVWSDHYSITQYGRAGVNGAGWSAGMADLSLWYVGENGYIYRADYKDFNGYSSHFLSDAFGNTTGPDTCVSAYKSSNGLQTDGSSRTGADADKINAENGGPYGISNGRCGPPYHIFFDSPALDLPATATLGDGSTVFVKPNIAAPQIASVTYEPTAEGSLAGTFAGTALNFSGNVELLLDVDNDGTDDLTVPGVVDADGNLTATWDGNDENSDPVPVTQQVKVSVQVSKLGEIHFIRDDVEFSGGIEVTLLNGLNNNGPEPVELNWDDTALAGGESGTEDGASRLCSTSPLAGSGSGNVHAWNTGPCAVGAGAQPLNQNNGTGGSWGDYRMIDDWTYETYQMDPYVIQIGPMPTVKVIKDVESRVTGSDDEFTVGVRTADDAELASATTEDGADSAETGAQGVLPDRTYTIFDTTTSGSNPITGYDSSVVCEDDSSNTVATTAGNAAGTWTITTPQSEVYVVEGSNATPIAPYNVTCTITNVAKDAPTAGPDTVTVDQGATATLNPEVTPGDGDIVSAAFDNGETTKVVPGEGTWSISVDDDGNVTATFTPEDGFTGPVTQQTYTVTDENGLTASSTLDVIIRPAAGDEFGVINPNETATLTPTVTPGSGPIETATFDNGATTKVVDGEGTWTISVNDGEVIATFEPEEDYFGPVTPQEYTVTDENGETATGELSVEINDPPQAGDDSETINPGETASLTPEVTPGTGAITGATFDNGETTKTVPGEGTWTISVDGEGNVTATFTPEDGYTGDVTPQEYTVTDENGLTASGELSVEINDPPEAGDASETINPNETATLTPEVTPGTGAIVEAAFDDGSTTKVVPGEGTWEISVDDEGNVTATFTPEDGYHGDVTPQEYTVTDENGLTASGELSVEINDPPQAGDQSETINPGETATLNPEVTPGTGAITEVTFDNGETTKVVPGEGTWEISVDDEGNVTATFTPENSYFGPVTPQEYTVSDENGLTATGELLVEINDPPQADDASTSVPQGETATLMPVVTPGDSPIVAVTFEDGSNEIVVPGEGTWTIELNDAGEVVATFTPEPDFYGVATPQKYTVTDENGLTATAELAVTVTGTKPSMELVKTAELNDKNGNGKADAGETIDYTFVVTNTGNTILTDVGVDDPMLEKLGIGVTCTPTALDPGVNADCAADKAYSVTAQDVKNGKVHNVATAHGTPPEGIDPPEEPKSEVEVPTGPVPKDTLGNTGGQVAWPLAAAGVLALLAGGALLMVRKRNREEQTL